MSMVSDLLRHAAARLVLRDASATPDQRAAARSVLGMPAAAPQIIHGVECYEAWRDLEDCPHERTTG
jgi:hypothetical protein